MLDTLNLPFAPGKTITLVDCFEAYFKKEELPAPDRCDKISCKRIGCRTRVERILVWPKVLCISLKRWLPTGVPGRFIKERRHVEAPAKLFNLGTDRHSYTLCSASVHEGDAGGGHYITVFKDAPTGIWRKGDDRYVSVYGKKAPSELLGQAYMLFYEMDD